MHAYKKETQPIQIMIISFLTGGLYLVLSIIDFLYAPKYLLSYLNAVHLIVIPGVLFSVAILSLFKQLYKPMIFIYMLSPVAATAINIVLVTTFEELRGYTGEVYLIIIWIFLVSGMNFRQSIISGFLTLGTVFLGALFTQPIDSLNFWLHLFYAMTAFIQGLVVAFLLKKSSDTVSSKQKNLEVEIGNKDLLLRELFHRVKNNLQIISSLLFLQSKKIEDSKSKMIFKENIKRIRAISLVHEKVYRTDNLEQINLKEFLLSLLQDLKQSINMDDIEFKVEAKELFVSLEKATPIGIIINEILTNAIKHAFTDFEKEKVVSIDIHKERDNIIVLEIADNGKGVENEQLKSSFGFKLINTLVEHQLGGTVEFSQKDGFGYTIKFQDSADIQIL